MSVRECTTEGDYVAWDRFVSGVPGAHYFQTYGWLKSYAPMGFTPHVLVHETDGALSGGVAFLSTGVPLVRWRVFIIPHGPLPAAPEAGSWRPLMQALDEFCRERHAVYAQLYPHEPVGETALISRLAELGFDRPAMFTSHRFSSTPVAIDLSGKTEDDLFRSLRKKTRQYLRRALSSALVLRTEVDSTMFDTIYQLLAENGESMGYEARPYASLRAAWDWFAPRDWATFIQAWLGDTLAGAILLVFTGRTAYYLAGAVRRGLQEQRPAEFLHWHGIQEALARQMTRYDLVNISTPGVEQFKSGFRPEVGSWQEPRTKLYSPVAAHTLHAAERYLRPLVRRAARLRANRAADASGT